MTVAELLDRISSAEITEWAALYQIEADEHHRQVEKAKSKSRRR
jgi:hypothetical protein